MHDSRWGRGECVWSAAGEEPRNPVDLSCVQRTRSCRRTPSSRAASLLREYSLNSTFGKCTVWAGWGVCIKGPDLTKRRVAPAGSPSACAIPLTLHSPVYACAAMSTASRTPYSIVIPPPLIPSYCIVMSTASRTPSSIVIPPPPSYLPTV